MRAKRWILGLTAILLAGALAPALMEDALDAALSIISVVARKMSSRGRTRRSA
jgi:hypothetical protein